MAIHKAVPLLGAGAFVGAGVAWLSGAIAPYGVPSPLISPAAISDVAPQAAKEELSALTQQAAEPDPAKPAPEAGAEAAAAAASAPDVAPSPAGPPTPTVPGFDIVRVQPDGSLVLAGRAPAGSAIDIMAGDRVIGSASADESGSFAFVLDTPLTPGDYEIGLVARSGDTVSASDEKALVQIPERPDGEVLAVVTAPGAATEVVSAGAQAQAASPATIAAPATAEELAAVAATTAPPPPPAPEPVAQEPAQAAGEAVEPAGVVIEPRIAAVEIDGDDLIISGTAAPAAIVRLYMDDAVVGDALADAAGGFALLSRFPVAPGQHTVRADVLAADGTVISRAVVPFIREAGEAVAVAAAPAPVPVASGGQPASGVQTAAAEVAAPEVEAPAQQPAQQPLVPAPDFGLGSNPPGLTAQTSVVIRKGDTLWQISRRVYGKGIRFSTIYNANAKQIADPDRIYPDQVFVMPALTDDGTPADFTGIDGQKSVDVKVN
ncbi:MAG: LysM peptidoglycan-binding domain-containing protein [Rhizobiaceae bacterium]|jgi:nucleoid-associated protein YgaU|nr:LysM peptidoglycan-binding domain-containing protein [Rhizobiaceae bacterium]